MYLLLVLIAVVSAQFINIPGREVEKTGQMSVDDREIYIDKFLSQKFKECRPFCISSKCGIKRTPERKVCRTNNLFNCVSGCDKTISIARNSWITYSVIITGNAPQISIKNAW
jgi:hypothetical protein